MEESTGSRWFKILVTVGSGFGTGFFIANEFFYGRIRSGSCNAVTRNEATVMMWINIILAIAMGLIFIWAIFMLLPIFGDGNKETFEDSGHKLTVKHKHKKRQPKIRVSHREDDKVHVHMNRATYNTLKSLAEIEA